MKLTTKRNRRYFLREIFSCLIPTILIIGTIDVFYHFMQCPLHPERSAPCSINWIFAIMYGIILVLVIILTIISTKKLRKVKKQIQDEFLESTTHFKKEENSEEIQKVKITKPKTIIVKSNKTSTKKITKKKS